MIPENDSDVQSADDLGAFVKGLSNGPDLPHGEVTGFKPTMPPSASSDDLGYFPDYAIQTPAQHQMLTDMVAMMELRNRALDKDVALIRSLRDAGFMIVTNPYMPDGAKVVTLPTSFDHAIEELERRQQARKAVVDTHFRYAATATPDLQRD